MIANREDSSRQRSPKQQLAFLAAMFEGLAKEGFTGVIKVHMHDGGIRSARREETIDLDWHGPKP